jgi:hypothetical protein
MAQTAGGEPVEEGVTLEKYAELAVALYDKEGPARAAAAASVGVDDTRVEEIVAAWMKRMESEPGLVQQYSTLYQQALVKAGVQRPDISVETYAQMMGAMSAGRPMDQVTKEHGMTIPQFAMVSQHWSEEMIANPQLAVRYAELMMAAQAAHKGMIVE